MHHAAMPTMIYRYLQAAVDLAQLPRSRTLTVTGTGTEIRTVMVTGTVTGFRTFWSEMKEARFISF